MRTQPEAVLNGVSSPYQHQICWCLNPGLPSHQNYGKWISITQANEADEGTNIPSTPDTQPPFFSRHTKQTPESGLHTCFFTVWVAFLPRNLQSLFSTPRPLNPLKPNLLCEAFPVTGPFFPHFFSPLLCFIYLQCIYYLLTQPVSSPHLLEWKLQESKDICLFSSLL